MKQKYGIQLYSVRDAAEVDYEAALAKVAAMGYTSVETAGFFGNGARELREMLRRNGLALTSTHSPLADLLPDKIDETVEFHRQLGNPFYVIPAAKLDSAEEREEFISIVEAAAPKLRDAGIELGYHNHSFEYEIETEDGCVMDTLEKRTSLLFELDTYWAWNAGRNPVEEMKRLGKRLAMIHLKDGKPGGEGTALGEGAAPIGDVIECAVALGIPMVVESEGLSPDGISEVSRCADYLKKNG